MHKIDLTKKHAEDHVITIPEQDTASSNQLSAITNNNNDISLTKVRENSEKLSLRQLIIKLNAHSKKNMVADSKRKVNISSNSKNAKSKNVLVIIGDSIIKDIKGRELSNESEKFVVKFFGSAVAKDMDSHIQLKIGQALSNAILH